MDTHDDVADKSELLVHEGILTTAYEDGSSVICPKCNALVPKKRADAHFNLWCAALGANALDDDDLLLD